MARLLIERVSYGTDQMYSVTRYYDKHIDYLMDAQSIVGFNLIECSSNFAKWATWEERMVPFNSDDGKIFANMHHFDPHPLISKNDDQSQSDARNDIPAA